MKGTESVKELVKIINAKFPGSKFESGADEKVIRNFEEAFGVTLPDSHKTFLLHFNGGFIPGLEAKTMIMQGEYEEAENLSTRFLSIEDIIDEYESLSVDRWKLKPDFVGFYPYIPFCIGDYNEKLVFVDQGKRKQESPVYLALHDEPASFWGVTTEDFTSFLKKYVESDGQPNITLSDDKPIAEDFLEELNERKAEVNDPEKLVQRQTAYIELFPKDSLSYTLRANAFTNLKQYENALKDYKHSLDLDPRNAFTHYCRGNMLLTINQFRQALTDLDSACQLDPDDPYHITARAEAFYGLNRMDKALADCNRALEIDDRFELAYMTRYQIYLYLGEAEKAEADAEILNEFLAEE